jgi:hypothetical protein
MQSLDHFAPQLNTEGDARHDDLVVRDPRVLAHPSHRPGALSHNFCPRDVPK